jgi:hypothetical protein
MLPEPPLAMNVTVDEVVPAGAVGVTTFDGGE